jgi:bifunctional DNase/RNase
MKKHRLDIYGLKNSLTTSGAYVLTLLEVDGMRRLPIIIGKVEAEAIAVEIEKIAPVRPLTHDLFRTFANAFEITLDEVIIYNFKEGVFYAMLSCTSKKDGTQHQIDSRTSDAIALAVRFDAPIYTYDKILNAAGVNLEEIDQQDFDANLDADNYPQHYTPPQQADNSKKFANVYRGMDDEELENALNNALEDEDYETASKIRDEITRRKKDEHSTDNID